MNRALFPKRLLRLVVCADDLPREVAAKVAIVDVLPAVRADLGAVAELRNPTDPEAASAG